MPIRFRCEDCGQLLSIARRKAGTKIECPRCRREVIVPGELPTPREIDQQDARRSRRPALLEREDFERVLGVEQASTRNYGARPAQDRQVEVDDPFEARTTWSPEGREVTGDASRSFDVEMLNRSERSRFHDDRTNSPRPASFLDDQPDDEPDDRPLWGAAAPTISRSPPDRKPPAGGTSPQPSITSAPTTQQRPVATGVGKDDVQFVKKMALIIGAVAAITSFLAGLGVGRYLLPATPTGLNPTGPTSRRPPARLLPGDEPKNQAGGTKAANADGRENNFVDNNAAAAPAVSLGTISGRINKNFEGAVSADVDAVVIAVHSKIQPDEKLKSSSFRPGLTRNASEDQRLKNYGGAIANVASDGSFQLNVESSATYWVLIISNGMKSPPGRSIDADVRGIFSKRFTDVDSLIGDRQYHLVSRSVDGGRSKPINFTFSQN